MADKDIIIGLKTTGDTSGAEEVKQSIFEVEDAAKRADREMDVLEAKRRVESRTKSAGTGPDIAGAAQTAGQQVANASGFGQEFHAASSALSADAIAVAGSFAAIGAAAVKSYQALDGTLDRFDKLKKLAKETGQSLGPELEMELEALRETMGPVKTVIDAVGGALDKVWKTVKDPVGELTGANDLEAAFKRQAEMAAALLKTRQKIATENQTEIAGIYGRELDKLKEQEETIKRITALRDKLGSLANERADQEVENSKLRGGDVALAEANALATKLRTGLDELSNDLVSSQQSAEVARTELNAAMVAQQKAIQDSLDKTDLEKFAQLNQNVDNAQKAFSDAQQAVTDQRQIFSTAKVNLINDVEIELGKLDTETKGPISKAAEQARTGIYQTVKEEFAAIGSETGPVKAAITEERTKTVQSIKELAPQPKDQAAVTGALQELGKGIAAKDDVIIANVAQLIAIVGAGFGRIEGLQTQVSQLAARIR